MAHDVYLGPSGAEVLLPAVNWMAGEPGEYPETFKKNFESATMLDGRVRYNFQSYSQRTWTLGWEWLTLAEVGVLQTLADLRVALRFWNGMVANPAWATVAVKSFDPILLISTVRVGVEGKYKAAMTLEEAG